MTELFLILKVCICENVLQQEAARTTGQIITKVLFKFVIIVIMLTGRKKYRIRPKNKL